MLVLCNLTTYFSNKLPAHFNGDFDSNHLFIQSKVKLLKKPTDSAYSRFLQPDGKFSLENYKQWEMAFSL